MNGQIKPLTAEQARTAQGLAAAIELYAMANRRHPTLTNLVVGGLITLAVRDYCGRGQERARG
jgi:hypothetical protein